MIEDAFFAPSKPEGLRVGDEVHLVAARCQFDADLNWKDIEWLCSLTKLPVLVKGILRGDDAVKALDHGAKGVVVVPIRTGLGWRLGVNLNYLKFTQRATWNPF